MKFKIGDTLKATYGKYKGRSVEATELSLTDPNAYTCAVYSHEKGKMVEILLFENELETVFEHDMNQLKRR